MKACSFYRKAVRWFAGSNARPPAWLQSHLRTCPGCRHVWDEEQQLSALLRASATRLQTIPAFLHTRIMAGLENAPEPGLAAGWGRSWVRPALVFGLALSLGAVLWVWRSTRQETTTPKLALSHPTAPGPLALAPAPAQLIAWSEKLDQPLQQEMDSVVHDARTALTSLGNNFLPSSLPAQADQ
jgi:hypothetical protein